MNVKQLLLREKFPGGYNFTPHSAANSRLRRLRQILTGKLEVDPDEYDKARALYHKLAMAVKPTQESE